MPFIFSSDVCVLSIFRDAVLINEDIKEIIIELEQEQQMPSINIELVDNELAMVWANSAKADVSSED